MEENATPRARLTGTSSLMRENTSATWNRIRSFVVDQHCIPWRISSRIRPWIETWLAHKSPSAYRLVRFGRLKDILKPITHGPRHHFFGYYEKPPWNASGSLILAHESTFNDRPPRAEDPVSVGVVRLHDGGQFEPVAQSHAWNWQQGSLLQWHPTQSEDTILYNDRRNGRFVSVVRRLDGSDERAYERPIYAIHPEGRYALSLNFSRLHEHRPGYGYPGIPDPAHSDFSPVEDGIFLLDMDSGHSRLLISLSQLASRNPLASMAGVPHWINHIQPSPGGQRFAFFHIWRTEKDRWSVRLYASNYDATDLHCVLDTGAISHYDWFDDHSLLVWAKHGPMGERFLLCDIRTGEKTVVGEGVLKEDGHCSFSPDGKWILNDTYPDRWDFQTLMLYKPDGNVRIDLARLYAPRSRWSGEIRCDLHPRWSRDGRFVCIDSVRSGERQMYIADVSAMVCQ